MKIVIHSIEELCELLTLFTATQEAPVALSPAPMPTHLREAFNRAVCAPGGGASDGKAAIACSSVLDKGEFVVIHDGVGSSAAVGSGGGPIAAEKAAATTRRRRTKAEIAADEAAEKAAAAGAADVTFDKPDEVANPFAGNAVAEPLDNLKPEPETAAVPSDIEHLRHCREFIATQGMAKYEQSFVTAGIDGKNIMAFTDADRAKHIAALNQLAAA